MLAARAWQNLTLQIDSSVTNVSALRLFLCKRCTTAMGIRQAAHNVKGKQGGVDSTIPVAGSIGHMKLQMQWSAKRCKQVTVAMITKTVDSPSWR
jgi:hypothetical protein